MIVGAVIRRELLSLLRKPRAYLLLLVFVVAAVLASWSTYNGVEPLRITDTARMADVAELWLRSLIMTLVAGACLFIPGVAGSAVAVERDQETFDLLSLTCARPMAILLGKLAASTAVFLIAAAAVMPVAAVALFLPGVDAADFAASMVHLVLLIVILGAFGILCSTLIRRSTAAIAASYLVCFMAVYGAAYLTGFALESLVYHRIPDWAAEIIDLEVLAYAAPAAMPFHPPATFDDRAWAVFTGLFMAYLPLAIARDRFHRAAQRPALAAPAVIDDAALLEGRRRKFPYYLFDPARRRALIPDGVNPMLVRELRWGLFGRAHIVIRVAYISLALGILSAAGLIYSAPDLASDFTRVVRILALCQLGFAALIVPALVCNVVTKESETGNLDMLRVTLLTPREIVLGKWLACCLSSVPFLVPLLAANFFVAAASVSAHGSGAGYYLAGAAWLVLVTVSAASLAFLGSAIADRTATAVVLSYLLVIACHFVLPLTLNTVWLWMTDDDREAFVFLVLLSPYVTAASSMYPENFGIAQRHIAAAMAGGVVFQFAAAAAAVALAGRAFVRRGLRPTTE